MSYPEIKIEVYGPPGCGKTYVLTELSKVLDDMGYVEQPRTIDDYKKEHERIFSPKRRQSD